MAAGWSTDRSKTAVVAAAEDATEQSAQRSGSWREVSVQSCWAAANPDPARNAHNMTASSECKNLRFSLSPIKVQMD
jgi:hypothetical protein